MIVIGDLHGYRRPLRKLLEKIDAGEGDLLVFIGDYVDRGPDSMALVETLIELKSRRPETVFLKGNHEDMLLGSIGMPAAIVDMSVWLYNGGSRTLSSYGMDEGEMSALRGMWDEEERRRKLLEYIPRHHIEFFLGLEMYVETENFFICHAGVSPYSTIEEGKENTFDLLWMRDHIYNDSPNWVKTVVCGHTPQRKVLIRERLICIDTGLYYYGTLSAIDLLTKKVYQARRSGGFTE